MSRFTLNVGLLTLLVTAVAGSAWQPASTEKHALRRHFAIDDTVYYVVDREISTRHVLLNVPLVTRRKHVDEWAERIHSLAPDGSANIEWILERVQYQKSDLKGDYRFDSLTDPPNQETRSATALVGQKLVARQKATGAATLGGVSGDKPPTASARNAAPAPAPAANAGSSAAAPQPSATAASRPASSAASRPAGVRPRPVNRARALYDREEILRFIARLTTDFLPAQPVASGESWTIEFDEQKPTFGKITHRLTCTLRQIVEADGGHTALIGVSGDCTVNAADAAEAAGDEASIVLKSARWSGDIRFDVDRGRLHSLTLRSDLSMALVSDDPKKKDFSLEMAEQQTIRVGVSTQPPVRPIVVQTQRPSATQAAGVNGAADGRIAAPNGDADAANRISAEVNEQWMKLIAPPVRSALPTRGIRSSRRFTMPLRGNGASRPSLDRLILSTQPASQPADVHPRNGPTRPTSRPTTSRRIPVEPSAVE